MKDSAAASSLALEAYNIVRQRIISGEIGLGQVISRRKLAAELSMSFLPVSEALLRLEFEGMLESRPRAGTRVRIPSPEDVQGHYVVREALEAQAAMRFAQFATPGERADLRRQAVMVDALALQPDRQTYVREHHRLHSFIAECSRCPALLDALERTHALSSIWFCAMRQPGGNGAERRHEDLVEWVASTDTAAAAEAVKQHLAVGLTRALEVLEPYFRLRTATGRTFHRSGKRVLHALRMQ
jgi:DNA-binding GntR family transcriptional regulator